MDYMNEGYKIPLEDMIDSGRDYGAEVRAKQCYILARIEEQDRMFGRKTITVLELLAMTALKDHDLIYAALSRLERSGNLASVYEDRDATCVLPSYALKSST